MRRAVVAVAFAALVVAGCGGGDDEPEAAPPKENVGEASPAQLPEEEDIEDAGAERLKVAADGLTAGGGAVWGNWESTMVRIDPDSGKQTDEIKVPQAPCGRSAFGYGAVWSQACFDEGLVRVDPSSLEVTHVPLEASDIYNGASGIGVGEGAVWVVADGEGCEACLLVGVDPDSLEVSHEIEIEPGGASVAVGLGSVWVANPEGAVVTRVDPKAGDVVSQTPVEGSPQYLAVGEGSAWVFDQLGGNVVELDSEGEESAVIEADMAGAGGSITTGNGSVWVHGALTLLEEIDAATGEVVARYGPRSGGGDVLVAYGAVWVSRYEEDFEDILRLPVPSP